MISLPKLILTNCISLSWIFYLSDRRFDYYVFKALVYFYCLEVLVKYGNLLFIVPTWWTNKAEGGLQIKKNILVLLNRSAPKLYFLLSIRDTQCSAKPGMSQTETTTERSTNTCENTASLAEVIRVVNNGGHSTHTYTHKDLHENSISFHNLCRAVERKAVQSVDQIFI